MHRPIHLALAGLLALSASLQGGGPVPAPAQTR